MKGRIETGIKTLDQLIEGGFPKSSLILLCGSPGSGKTIASAQFLHHGISKLNESGVYISFGERKEVFYENMKKFGFNFEEFEKKGKFKFLDMMTPGDKALSIETINIALTEIQYLNAKRLVIDSFTAMSTAFKDKKDARIILHLLEKVMRQIGCTTLLIVEIPTWQQKMGFGFEEFLADGIILFETFEVRSGIRKRAIIRKMRGTDHNQNYTDIVISKDGIALMPYVS